jgi:hypothetical protein
LIGGTEATAPFERITVQQRLEEADDHALLARTVLPSIPRIKLASDGIQGSGFAMPCGGTHVMRLTLVIEFRSAEDHKAVVAAFRRDRKVSKRLAFLKELFSFWIDGIDNVDIAELPADRTA